MDILKDLSPEQIKALTPECLQIILQHDKIAEDIATLKHNFSALKYKNNGDFDAYYDELNVREIKRLLLKHNNKTFYLTYLAQGNECANNRSHSAKNWQLHTEEEIKMILSSETQMRNIWFKEEKEIIIPTNIELEKICFSKDNFPLKIFISYLHCEKNPSYELSNIEQLVNYHDNLKIIHPVLLRAACHFYNLNII